MQATESYSAANGIAMEALANIRTVLSFNAETSVLKKYSQVSFQHTLLIEASKHTYQTEGYKKEEDSSQWFRMYD